MIDLAFRAFTRDRWIQWATSKGVYNDEGFTINGYDVDEIGFVEISPGVFDDWWFVHLRMSLAKAGEDVDSLYPGEAEDGFQFTKSKLVAFVRNQATPITLMGWRAYQFGTGVNRVQLVDSRDYATGRKREYLGGVAF